MNGARPLKVEFRLVRAILWAEWDPIGCGVPEDEYDDYVWPVIRLLRAGAGRDAVIAFLEETAQSLTGRPVPWQRNAEVADRLAALAL